MFLVCWHCCRKFLCVSFFRIQFQSSHLIQLKKKFEKSVTMLGELQDTRAARDELLSEFHEHELVRIPGLTQSLVNLVKAESSSAPLGGAFIPQQTCVLHMLFPR